MKKILIIGFLSVVLTIHIYGDFNINRDDDILIAPNYLASFYDSYTRNYLNTRTLGMGNTGVAMRGGIQYALSNPASFKGGAVNLFIEGGIKNEVQEMNRYIKVNPDNPSDTAENFDERQSLEAGVPAVALGLGAKIIPELSVGAIFSIPQTVRYNVFGRMLKTGAYTDRFPSLINYQTILTTTGHFGNFNAGLNLIMNNYSFKEVRVENTFDRVSFSSTIFRLQPGLLYHTDSFSIGAAYKLPAEKTFEVGNIPSRIYKTYDVTLPALLEAGAAYVYQDDITIALGVEFEETSTQFADFDDRLTIKGGVEKKYENYDLRVGMISTPAIYKGKHHNIITSRPDNPQEDPFEFDVQYDHMQLIDTSQFILTGGITYKLPLVDFSLALAKDILGNFDLFQVTLSFDIKLGQMILESESRREY